MNRRPTTRRLASAARSGRRGEVESLRGCRTGADAGETDVQDEDIVLRRPRGRPRGRDRGPGTTGNRRIGDERKVGGAREDAAEWHFRRAPETPKESSL